MCSLSVRRLQTSRTANLQHHSLSGQQVAHPRPAPPRAKLRRQLPTPQSAAAAGSSPDPFRCLRAAPAPPHCMQVPLPFSPQTPFWQHGIALCGPTWLSAAAAWSPPGQPGASLQDLPPRTPLPAGTAPLLPDCEKGGAPAAARHQRSTAARGAGRPERRGPGTPCTAAPAKCSHVECIVVVREAVLRETHCMAMPAEHTSEAGCFSGVPNDVLLKTSCTGIACRAHQQPCWVCRKMCSRAQCRIVATGHNTLAPTGCTAGRSAEPQPELMHQT